MKTKVEITPSLNKQISNEFEAKRELFPSTSQHDAGASSEGSISGHISNLSKKESQNLSTPVDRKWADICESSIGSPKTQGWAIAAASLPLHKSFSPKKKESLSLVIFWRHPIWVCFKHKRGFNSQIQFSNLPSCSWF